MSEKPARPPSGPSPLGALEAKLRDEQRAHEIAMREGSDIERFNREVLAARERRRKAAENPGVWRIGESPGTGGHTVYLGTELAAVFLDPVLAAAVTIVANEHIARGCTCLTRSTSGQAG